jgi:hypothetical protein
VRAHRFRFNEAFWLVSSDEIKVRPEDDHAVAFDAYHRAWRAVWDAFEDYLRAKADQVRTSFLSESCRKTDEWSGRDLSVMRMHPDASTRLSGATRSAVLLVSDGLPRFMGAHELP